MSEPISIEHMAITPEYWPALSALISTKLVPAPTVEKLLTGYPKFAEWYLKKKAEVEQAPQPLVRG